VDLVHVHAGVGKETTVLQRNMLEGPGFLRGTRFGDCIERGGLREPCFAGRARRGRSGRTLKGINERPCPQLAIRWRKKKRFVTVVEATLRTLAQRAYTIMNDPGGGQDKV
jgi:hypothetical protein